MSQPSPLSNENRRREPRNVSAGRMTWRSEANGRHGWGWVSDASTSGLCFITSMKNHPMLEEPIRVINSRLGYRVIRVNTYDRDLVLVACARDESPLSAALSADLDSPPVN